MNSYRDGMHLQRQKHWTSQHVWRNSGTRAASLAEESQVSQRMGLAESFHCLTKLFGGFCENYFQCVLTNCNWCKPWGLMTSYEFCFDLQEMIEDNIEWFGVQRWSHILSLCQGQSPQHPHTGVSKPTLHVVRTREPEAYFFCALSVEEVYGPFFLAESPWQAWHILICWLSG